MAQTDESLYDRLTRYLDAGQFHPGERLGSERSLAEQFGVTRSELRHVLSELETEGHIRRTIGRAGGVFRWDGKIERHLNAVEGVPDMLRQQGFRPTTTVLRSEIAHATPVESRALRLPDADPVFRLQRRRDADGIPLSIDSMTLPLRLLPGFQSLDHTASVYRMLAEKYGIEAAEANETIDVTPAPVDLAELLGIAPGDPLLEIRRVTYDHRGVAFEFAHDYFTAARTRITLRRQGARWKRAAEGRSARA